MSKNLLSGIKRLKPNPKSTHEIPVPTQIKRLVVEVCEILRTQTQWEEMLETRLSVEEIVPSEIAHLVFDKIHNADLGLKFFGWVSDRPYGCSLDGFAYSSLLKLLAKFKVFSEVEAVLKSMKCQGKVPSCEAFDVILRAYSDCGLVDKAVELFPF